MRQIDQETRPLTCLTLAVLAVLAVLAGCGSSSSTADGPPGVDAPPSADARPGSVDAPGNPGSVDAPVSSGSIDAPGNPGSVDAPAAANASITLSGDQTGTFSAVAAAGTDSSTGTSLVGIVVPNPPSEFTAIAISVEVSGTLSAKDYATTDFTTAAAEVAAAGNKFYSASIGDNAAGSFGTLHLTSVEPLGQDGTSTVYTVHGSLDASVDAIAGGDPVTLAATF